MWNCRDHSDVTYIAPQGGVSDLQCVPRVHVHSHEQQSTSGSIKVVIMFFDDVQVIQDRIAPGTLPNDQLGH